MYCHYCGRPSTARCAACGHRICPAHARNWLVAVVCKKCNRAVLVGVLSVAILLLISVIVYFAAKGY
jgi:hypothetical protein